MLSFLRIEQQPDNLQRRHQRTETLVLTQISEKCAFPFASWIMHATTHAQRSSASQFEKHASSSSLQVPTSCSVEPPPSTVASGGGMSALDDEEKKGSGNLPPPVCLASGSGLGLGPKVGFGVQGLGLGARVTVKGSGRGTMARGFRGWESTAGNHEWVLSINYPLPRAFKSLQSKILFKMDTAFEVWLQVYTYSSTEASRKAWVIYHLASYFRTPSSVPGLVQYLLDLQLLLDLSASNPGAN